MDIGLDRLSKAVADMANIAQDSVMKAIQAYVDGQRITEEALSRAKELSMLADEIQELAVEILARYQPVATDLRFIKSCLDISYGLARFGRYAYDIAEVLELCGDLSACEKSIVKDLSGKVARMIQTSIRSFTTRDPILARTLRHDDDEVDEIYRNHIKQIAKDASIPVNCALASTLVLRYLERIGDHACYIGDSVTYILSGSKT